MPAASEYRYKSLEDDVRNLGPPHQRFPSMYPDRHPAALVNEVFLETNTTPGNVRRTFLAVMGGVCIFVGVLIGWGTSFFDEVVLGTFGFGALCALSALLITPPLPLRLNRQTREAIVCYRGHITRMPWDQMPVRIDKVFNLRGAHSTYSLQFGFGHDPEHHCYIDAAADFYEESALRAWEYFCRYMEVGPPMEVREVSEEEKSSGRLVSERSGRDPITTLLSWFVMPMIVIMVWLSTRSLRQPPPWPQEIIDICENHPLLQGKPLNMLTVDTNQSKKPLPRSPAKRAKSHPPARETARTRAEAENLAMVERRGDFEEM